MKLVTEIGELALPKEMSIEVTRNNPFFSDEGDATYPTELPASAHNLRVMGQPNRADNSRRPFLKQPAILSVGHYQLHGTLIMSAADRKTVTAALAIDNGDLWTNYRDKTLQEIVGDDTLISFNTMAALCQHINAVNDENRIYKFPVVAIEKYQNDKGVTIYQMNNEPDTTTTNTASVPYEIVHEERFVKENGNTVSVPDGYGIAPQLLLFEALNSLFTAMGYTLKDNFFSASPWNKILLLNNTSDAACKLRFKLSEMLPTCTLSEFCTFLKNKFHVVVVADSASKIARIIRMEDILAPKNAPDIDISPLLDGRWSFEYHGSTRVVLSDDVSIDGALPAKETVAAMEEKYSSCQPVDETDFASLGNYQHPELLPYFDCLILRKATGEYCRLVHDINDGKQRVERLGTNAMTYDRQNSEDTEEFAASDLFAPVVDLGNGVLAPYVGSRIHYNTHLTTDTDTDSDNVSQGIIVAWYIGMQTSDGKMTYRFCTNQHYDSKGTADPYCSIDLTPLGLYDTFWKRYNRIILNGKVEVEGHVCYKQAELQSIDMIRTKLFGGQRLLPETMSYALGEKIVCGMSRFLALKEYADMVDDDTNIFPLPEHKYKWVWMHPDIDQYVEDNTVEPVELEQGTGVYYSVDVTWEFTDGATGSIWLDQPSESGLVEHRCVRYIKYTLHTMIENQGTGTTQESFEYVNSRAETWFESVLIE